MVRKAVGFLSLAFSFILLTWLVVNFLWTKQWGTNQKLFLVDSGTSYEKTGEKPIIFLPKTPTYDSIFAQDHSWVATISAERLRTLMATGDVILARSVNLGAVKRGNFKWPFEKTAEILRSGDLTFVNLEVPLTSNCQPTSEGMIFCGDQRNIEGLVFAGIDVANFANNHMGNYGLRGVEQTAELLSNNGVLVAGTGSAAIKDVRGLRFAFLGYNSIDGPEKGILWASEGKIASDIEETKKTVDVVVVSFHWGDEYTEQPTRKQRNLAHLAIDRGADLVLGNHPHWIQPVEIYKEKLITYAHGNFIFDQMWSEKTREGAIGRYTFYDNRLIDVEFIPIVVQDYGQPNFPEPQRERSILDSMREESLKLASYPL